MVAWEAVWFLGIFDDPLGFPEEKCLKCRKTEVKEMTPRVLIFKTGRKELPLTGKEKSEGGTSFDENIKTY